MSENVRDSLKLIKERDNVWCGICERCYPVSRPCEHTKEFVKRMKEEEKKK